MIQISKFTHGEEKKILLMPFCLNAVLTFHRLQHGGGGGKK